MAAVPSLLLLAAAAAMVLWRRKVDAPSASLASLGIALLALMLLMVAAFGIDALYPLQDSMVYLLGAPLGVYAVSMGLLVRRCAIGLPGAIACAMMGLVALYFLGGYVLMNSACSFGTGGC